jgi:hypothetical protein
VGKQSGFEEKYMDEMEQLVDINLATQAELCALPGVGAVLAERIIAARPFGQVDDLTRVRGITLTQVDKWRPFLTLPQENWLDQPGSETSAGDELLPPQEENTLQDETSPTEDLPPQEQQPDVEHSTEEDAQAEAPQPFSLNFEPPAKVRQMAADLPQQFRTRMDKSAPLSQGQAWVWGGALAFLVLILAVAISLGLLGGINGGLNYASYNKVTELQSQMLAVDTRLKQLQQDTASLQERMSALEGLSARIGLLESDNTALKEQLASQTAEIQKLSEQNNQIKTQMSQLEESNKHFKQFFDGLKGLVNTVFKDAQ